MKYIFKYGAVHTEELLSSEEIKENEKTLGKLQGLIENRGFIKVDNRTKPLSNENREEEDDSQ